MFSRKYDYKKDKEAVHRIWQEIGWIKGDNPEPLDLLLKSEHVLVADLHGEAECMVLTTPGDLRYQDETLPYGVVAAVTTSQVARRQGLARRLTAQAVAQDAASGVAVAGLGMFEQGFYNQLGFGSCAYEHRIRIDPGSLKVKGKPRPPLRLSDSDGARVHASRLQRWRAHGSVSIHDVNVTHADIAFSQKYFTRGFGLGYQDEQTGELTHHLWGTMEDAEHGPLRIWWMVYRTPKQLHELLALIQAQSDQVNWVSVPEPPGVQMQDLVKQPFRQRRLSERSNYPAGIQTHAFFQARICDLEACLLHTHLPAGEVRFNLELHDPIGRYLDAEAPWRGIGGNYVVTLGSESAAERGKNDRLPTLKASVGTFTRLWLGVRPAYGLTVSDDLSGPPELLEAIDAVVRLPVPVTDWSF